MLYGQTGEIVIKLGTVRKSKGYRDGYSKGLADGRIRQIQKLKDEISNLQKKIRQAK